MLSRPATVVAVTVAMIAIIGSPAHAAEPECSQIDRETGVCRVWAVAPGEPGGDGSAADAGSGGGGGGGAAGQPVVSMVVNGQQCIYTGRAEPQPPRSEAVWEGRTDGAIYGCAYNNGPLGDAVTLWFWAAGPAPAPPPPDPQVLAQQALSQMNLQAIDIGIVPEDAPGRVGIIGLPTWMWAEAPGETTMGPVTRSASAGGYTVTATAAVNRIVWTMGDGTTVTCPGPGTPYADNYGAQSSPTCGHTYTRQGQYTVTATSYWTVNWAGIGETGTIPLDLTASTLITMGESQVINQ